MSKEIEKLEFSREDNEHSPETNILWQIKDKINEIIEVVNNIPSCDCDSCIDFRNDD